MPVMRLEPGKSPLDAISNALQLVNSVYGIKANSAALEKAKMEQTRLSQQNEMGDIELAKTKRYDDPTSQESQLVKQDASALLTDLASRGNYKNNKQITALQTLVSDPETTGTAVKSAVESSPFLKHVTTLASKDMGIAYLASAMANRNANTQEKTDLSANQKYSQELKPIESTIQAANRVEHIIGQIESGELKSTPTLRQDLTAALGQMFNNGKSATVYGMSHSDIDSLQSRSARTLSFISGQPVDTIPTAQLDQLKKDVQSLRSTYSDAHEVAYSSFREGLPERVRTKLDARAETFRNKAIKREEGSGAPGVNSANAGESAPPHGPSVIQNGHTFNWNPQTKKYE